MAFFCHSHPCKLAQLEVSAGYMRATATDLTSSCIVTEALNIKSIFPCALILTIFTFVILYTHSVNDIKTVVVFFLFISCVLKLIS